jgi:hypothetical protein
MDDDSRTLFECLSEEGRRLAPVSYRFSRTSPVSGALFTRLAESRPYRAGGYVCWPFRKPISKCCGRPDDENEDGGHGA